MATKTLGILALLSHEFMIQINSTNGGSSTNVLGGRTQRIEAKARAKIGRSKRTMKRGRLAKFAILIFS